MRSGVTRQEAKIESKTTEIQSLHRDLQSTQDSLNNWDEVNLNSVEGVYVDDRDGTSISSESRVAGPAISHFPKGGGDPALLPQRARSMPKAAQTKTATPSTQPASNSKASLAVPNSSVPTASSPIEITAPTITVLDFGGPKQREAEHISVYRWPQLAEQSSEFGKSASKTKSLILRSIPEPVCYGLVKLRILKVLTVSKPSASFQLENQYQTSRILISRLQGDSGRSSLRTPRNRLPQPKELLNQRDHLRADRLLGWSTTSSKWVATMKASWTTEMYRSSSKERPRSTQSGTKYYQQSLTDLLTTNWRVCTKCKLKHRESWDMCCNACLRWRDDIRRQEHTTIADWSKWSKDILSRKRRILISKREIETWTDWQWELRAKVKTKEKAKNLPKNNSERGECIRWIFVHSQAWTKTRKAKGRDDFVHVLRQVHRTQIRKVMEEVVMTEVQKAHQNLLVKVRQGKRTGYFVCTSRGEVVRREIRAIFGMLPNVHDSKPSRMLVRKQVCIQTHTPLNLLTKRKNSKYCNLHPDTLWTPDAIANDSVGWQDPIPSKISLSRDQVCSESEKLGTYTGSHPDRIRKSAKSKRSNFRGTIHRMDLAHGSNGKEISLDIAQERVQNCKVFVFWETESWEQCVVTSRKRDFIVDWGASFRMMGKSGLTPEEQAKSRKSKDPAVVMTANGTTHTTEEATVHVCDLDVFVQVRLLTTSPAVLSMGKLFREIGYS